MKVSSNLTFGRAAGCRVLGRNDKSCERGAAFSDELVWGQGGVASDKVLVTGASGFVGSAVVKALLEANYPVRVFLRRSSPRINIANLDVEVAEGDVCDPASITQAMSGVRFLFHLAADYRLWAPEPGSLMQTNRDGTRNLMRAALAAGVERIVYTSSVATIALPRNGGCLADETMRHTEASVVGAYKRSKVAAERLVEEMIVNDNLPAVIVHPSTPIGPRDVKPTPTGRIIVEAALGRVPGYVDTGLNLVHVDDVAAGHIAALHHGKTGEHYILGGQNVPLATMLAEVACLNNRKPPWMRLPRPLIYPFALASEAVAHVTGREPFLTLDGLRMSKYTMFFSSAKAERDLSYHARPYREALVEAMSWFREHGYLR
jgi:dihydroflavonol-4-reductase